MPSTVTYTIKSAGGDYSSITGWIAGVQANFPNLVTSDVVVEGACYNFQLTENSGVAIASVTTDATRFLRLFCPAGEGHNGTSRDVSGTGFQLVDNGTGGTGTLRINVQYLRIEGLDIKNTYAGGTAGKGNCIAYSGGTFTSGGNSHLVSGCILHNASASGVDYVVPASVSNLVLTFRNNIVYSTGTGGRGIDIRSAASGCTLSFNTFQTTGATGVLVFTSHVLKNNWVGGATTCFSSSGTFTGSNNASTDATGDDASMSSGALISQTAANQFINSTPGSSANFLLKAGNALAGAGVAVTGITTDIIGATRASPPAIGAAEPVTATGAFTVTYVKRVNILQTGP